MWEPWKQGLLASRDVIISSQFAAQIRRGFFTLGDWCWLPITISSTNIVGLDMDRLYMLGSRAFFKEEGGHKGKRDKGRPTPPPLTSLFLCNQSSQEDFEVLARLQSEFFARKIFFFRATNFVTKNTPKFSPPENFEPLSCGSEEKIPQNSLQISHSIFQISLRKISKKFTDELLQEVMWKIVKF